MCSTVTYYLIDYENVNSSGLVGCEDLTETDTIIIFFTKHAMKINMSDIANHGDSRLEMIEVPAGKQSTDIHISSYIGYLVGLNNDPKCNIYVVSKDTDFDNVANFWQNRKDIKISRVEQIKSVTNPCQSVKTIVKPSKKTLLNNEVLQTLNKSGFESDISSFVASTVVKNINVDRRKQVVYRTIISKYGQNEGLNIYNQIKNYI